MARRGRPKKSDKAKNRAHTIYLDSAAERIFRKVTKARGNSKWIHEYLSNHIKRDFSHGKEQILVQELLELQATQRRIERRIFEKATELREYRASLIQKKSDQLLQQKYQAPKEIEE